MQDFFARVTARPTAPWPVGRRDLHWHVLFPVAEVQRQLTEPYRGLTHRQGIEPVAPEWVHMTVLHSGPEDEATTQEVEEITTRVREAVRGIAPFEVTFAVPSVGNVAVECAGRPGAPARRLWQATYEATAAVVGDRWARLPEAYYPHVSLGYGTSEAERADRTQMKVWLSDHAGAEVTLRATALSFVAQWHTGRQILWDPIAEIPLTGAS